MGELILSLDNYSIYKNNGYYICVANVEVNNYQMFMAFSEKDLANLSNGDVINEIKKIGDLIFSRSKDIIYILPVISPLELEKAAMVNDDKEYNRILNTLILPVTSDVYAKFVSRNKHINDVVSMIRQNDIDQKIIHWIDMKLMRNGVDFIQEVDVNTFRNNRSIDIGIPTLEHEMSRPTDTSTSGIAPIEREYEVPVQNKNNSLVKKLTKPEENSHGFSSMKFIVMVLSVAILAGVAIAAWLIK